MDFFQDSLANDRLETLKKKKDIDWLFKADFRLVRTEEQLRDLIALLSSITTPISADTETTGLRVKEDKLVGISLGWQIKDKFSAAYIPIYSEVETLQLSRSKALSLLKPILERPLVYFNAKFDYQVLKHAGLSPQVFSDVSIMQFCLKDGIDELTFNHYKDQSLKERYKEIFKEDVLDLEDLLGKGNHNFALASLDLAKVYAACDAYTTLKLYHHFSKLVDTTKGFIYDLEMKLIKVVAEMEYAGIRLDKAMIKKAQEQVNKECEQQLAEIHSLAGGFFEINSGPQLADVLFNKLGLPVQELTAKGHKPKTDAKTLERLKGMHPIVDVLLTYKTNARLLSGFLDKLPDAVEIDEHIHTSYRSWGTISGRFTSKGPNLQQIPKGKKGSNKSLIRNAFIADPGHYFLDVDYSQIEYRVFASMCGDKNLADAFYKDVDFHTNTASIMFGVPLDQVTNELRQRGKTINFGLLYGMSPYGLARQLKCSEGEAEELYEKYFQAMPDVKPWVESIHAIAIKTKATQTYFGRKRLLPDVTNSDNRWRNAALRESVNSMVQGGAADILKIAMLRLSKYLEGKNIQILLQVHDELLFQAREDVPIEEAISLIRKGMELQIQGFVPIKADFSIGYSWGNMLDYEEGITLDSLPVGIELAISLNSALSSAKAEVKKILAEHKGKIPVFINDGSKNIALCDRIDDKEVPVLVDYNRVLKNKLLSLGLELV